MELPDSCKLLELGVADPSSMAVLEIKSNDRTLHIRTGLGVEAMRVHHTYWLRI
jgi:hypothetical protein